MHARTIFSRITQSKEQAHESIREDFGCEVLRGAAHGLGERALADDTRQAKVTDAHHVVLLAL